MASGPNGGPAKYREITVSAILFAIILGIVINAAITYAGLKIGFTITGSAIAAVLGFGVLRGLLRRVIPGAGSILETNIAQTAGSSVDTACSGIIFTVPVLLLLGIPLVVDGPDFWLIILAAVGGAILGTAFIIPLRKQMIDIDRLRFPSGTGVAVVLKSPGAGIKKSVVLVAGMLLSALIYLPAGLPQITRPAGLDDLDRLVERERITPEDAERTRVFAGWIESESAPADVLARGAALVELRDLRDQLATDPSDEALRRQRDALAATVADAAIDHEVTDAAAIAAFEASTGAEPWDALRRNAMQTGWALKPLPGYSDLGIRMPARRDAEGNLRESVDHDGNGRPDLVLHDHEIQANRIIGLPDQFHLVFEIAPFAIGAGFLSGKAGLMTVVGGALAYLFLAPLAYMFGWLPETLLAHDTAEYSRSAFNRPLGIGLLLGGAMMGIAASAPAIRAALKSIFTAGRRHGGSDELGGKTLIIAVIAALGLLFVTETIVGSKPLNDLCPVTGAQVGGFERGDPRGEVERPTREHGGYTLRFVDEGSAAAWDADFDEAERGAFLVSLDAKPGLLSGLPGPMRGIIIALVGAAWIWLAGIIIAQCTGMTDWSPISGMALITVVLVLMLLGTGAVLGAVILGVALCVAITLAADMMQDLKTGHLVGGVPRRQQFVELSVVWMGPIVSMFVLLIIASANMKSYGVPIGDGTPTTAPQAQALQAVITGVQGGEMPYTLYGMGAVMGALLGLGAFSGLGVLIGLSMYLPFQAIATYGIGCVLEVVIRKWKGARWSEEWGVPFAAGMIVGEALVSLTVNLIVLATS